MKEGLEPFTEYEFRLIASNPHGQTETLWQTTTTRQDRKYRVTMFLKHTLFIPKCTFTCVRTCRTLEH